MGYNNLKTPPSSYAWENNLVILLIYDNIVDSNDASGVVMMACLDPYDLKLGVRRLSPTNDKQSDGKLGAHYS